MHSVPSRLGVIAALFGACAIVGSCGADPTVGPDALRPETFQLSLINGQSLPYVAYTLGFGAPVYITSARIKTTVPGRSVDPRIFDDRSGNGPQGGGSRDSTNASASMADIREFHEGSPTAKGVHVDTSTVTVERHGDLIIITREHPDPARTMVDTGHFESGKLWVYVHEWERFGTRTNSLFVYSIVK